MGSVSGASCAAGRGWDQQLLFLSCFSDILLMQQSCGQSKSHTKKMYFAMYFAGLVLLMLLEERKPKRCFCISENIARNTVP